MSHFTPRVVSSMYDNWANRYDDEFAEKKYVAPKTLHRVLSRYFDLQAAGLRVLDVGIGMGWLAREFKAANPDCIVTGVDISKDMHEKCRSKGVADRLVVADFQTDGLPFADDSFDIVVSSGVFELLDRPDKVIEDMGRVLRPSGGSAITVYADASNGYTCTRHDDDLIEGAFERAAIETQNLHRFLAFNHYGSDIYYNLYTGRKFGIS